MFRRQKTTDYGQNGMNIVLAVCYVRNSNFYNDLNGGLPLCMSRWKNLSSENLKKAYLIPLRPWFVRTKKPVIVQIMRTHAPEGISEMDLQCGGKHAVIIVLTMYVIL